MATSLSRIRVGGFIPAQTSSRGLGPILRRAGAREISVTMQTVAGTQGAPAPAALAAGFEKATKRDASLLPWPNTAEGAATLSAPLSLGRSQGPTRPLGATSALGVPSRAARGEPARVATAAEKNPADMAAEGWKARAFR